MKVLKYCVDKIFPSEKLKSDTESRTKAYSKIVDKFFDNKSVKQLSEFDQASRFHQLVSKVTNSHLELPENKIPNVEQLKNLKPLVKKDLKLMLKKPSWFSRHFYLGTEFVKNHPFMASQMDRMLQSNEALNVDKSVYSGLASKVMDFMRKASEEEGFKVANMLRGGKPKSLIKLQGLQNKYINIFNRTPGLNGKPTTYNGETGPAAARAFRIMEGKPEHYKESLEYFAKEGEGKIYTDFMTYVSLSDLEFKRQRSFAKKKDVNVFNAAEVWREDILKKSNADTVSAWSDFISILNNLKSSDKETIEWKNVNNFAKNQLEKFKGYEKSHKGLFPVMTLEVFPTLDANLSKMITPRKGTNDFEDGAKSILSLKDVINDNIYKNQNLTDNAVVPDIANLNYNYIGLLDSYTNTASKLKHSLANTGAMLEVIRFTTDVRNRGKNLSNENTKKTEYDEINSGLQDYMANTYMYQMGLKDIDPQTGAPTMSAKIARMATSAQFFSKLGFNMRSMARNSAQALFHYVHFGVGHTHKLLSDLKKDKLLQTRVDIGMEKSGLNMAFGESANIREVYGQLIPERIYNKETGRMQAKLDFSMLDKLDNAINQASAFSGKGMQWVENNINRGYAYKLGYVRAWQADSANKPRVRKQFEWSTYKSNNRKYLDNAKIKEDINSITGDTFLGPKASTYDVKFENFRRERAQNAARDIVRLIHFDYSQINKAPILRSKTGATLGQFQHYGMNLFVLQKKWIGEGLKDVSKGDLFGEKAARMHRLFFMNTMVHGIMSPLLNTDIGNLIQNDTMDRAEKWWTFWSENDDEKRAQAFYNKGPVAGSLGPTVGTVLDIKKFVDETFDLGEQVSWYDELDDNGPLSYMTGREYAAERDDDLTAFGTLLNMFNIQMGRLWNGTLPRAAASRNFVGSFISSELSLYPTPETQALREAVPILNTSAWNATPKSGQSPNFDAAILQSLNSLEKNI